MKKKIGIAILIGLFLGMLGRGLFYHEGFYSPPSSQFPSLEAITVPEMPLTEFIDAPEKGEGKILIDFSHSNRLSIEELSILASRLISRGLNVETLNEESLKEELPKAKGLIIACPAKKFSKEGKEAIEDFVKSGGKLLLIGDPTRKSEINSLSLKFGLIFEADYLYNLKENDAYFRNIFISQFRENELTKGLKKIVLYTAGSITCSDNCSIALTDENTFSSLIETRKELSPIALTKESKVLAIYDFTFMIEPYNGICDNNRLISNIADWLAGLPKEKAKEEVKEEKVK